MVMLNGKQLFEGKHSGPDTIKIQFHKITPFPSPV